MQEGATSDFAMESAEIIPVTVNGLDGQLFLEENWKKQQSTVTCIDISSNFGENRKNIRDVKKEPPSAFA